MYEKKKELSIVFKKEVVQIIDHVSLFIFLRIEGNTKTMQTACKQRGYKNARFIRTHKLPRIWLDK